MVWEFNFFTNFTSNCKAKRQICGIFGEINQ